MLFVAAARIASRLEVDKAARRLAAESKREPRAAVVWLNLRRGNAKFLLIAAELRESEGYFKIRYIV